MGNWYTEWEVCDPGKSLDVVLRAPCLLCYMHHTLTSKSQGHALLICCMLLIACVSVRIWM